MNKSQEKVLAQLHPWEVVEEHSDGDLTINSRGTLFVVTTTGKVFREEKLNTIEKYETGNEHRHAPDFELSKFQEYEPVWRTNEQLSDDWSELLTSQTADMGTSDATIERASLILRELVKRNRLPIDGVSVKFAQQLPDMRDYYVENPGAFGKVEKRYLELLQAQLLN